MSVAKYFLNVLSFRFQRLHSERLKDVEMCLWGWEGSRIRCGGFSKTLWVCFSSSVFFYYWIPLILFSFYPCRHNTSIHCVALVFSLWVCCFVFYLLFLEGLIVFLHCDLTTVAHFVISCNIYIISINHTPILKSDRL